MSTHEERAAAEAQAREMLAGGAEARLLDIPGVYHVSVGAKERGGGLAQEMCIRVYVRKKQPLESIAPRDRIPREIGGLQTDVNVVQGAKPLANFGRYRPVKGGIAISNMIPVPVAMVPGSPYGFNVGTFGCTAKRWSGGKPVLLTACHVLMVDDHDQENHLIFQPGDGIPVKDAPPPGPKHKDFIARVIDYTVDCQYTEKVDAGIAELDVSSCCRCCCGLEVKDEILGLTAGVDGMTGPPTNDKIIGKRRPAHLDVVYKVGIATGWTRGAVADASGPVPDYNVGLEWPTLQLVDQILIVSDVPAKWTHFLEEGDSGSAVIDENGFIVGLGFGHEKKDDPNSHSFANNIVNVCDALKIDIIFTDPSKIAGRRIAPPAFDAAGMMDEQAYAEARERVLAHPMAQHVLAKPAGAWLFALGEAHREEVVRLVTTHRPVSVAWHRAGGPALFAKGLEAFREDRDLLPVPAHGGSLEAALAQIGNALAAHGSPALRDAIAAHREELLGAVRDSATVDDVLRKLAPAVLSEA